ncbi:hypothetical protein Q3C01_10675 [Bradyrhizobium sp. UFLA05-109]
MTTLFDKKGSAIGNAQNSDRATLDQMLSRTHALAPVVAQDARDMEQDRRLFVADRVAGDRKFIWPLAATLMLIVLVWALATEFSMSPEQRAAIFAVQSQAYP